MELLGVRNGLAALGMQQENLTGVALFADYTTQPDEWQQYQQTWLQPPTPGKPP